MARTMCQGLGVPQQTLQSAQIHAPSIGWFLGDAMEAINRGSPLPKGVLPKYYVRTALETQ